MTEEWIRYLSLADRFAELNGWKRSQRLIRCDQLAANKAHRGGRNRDMSESLVPGLNDHQLYFRKDRLPIAICFQPYSQIDVVEALRLTSRDLVVHCPPEPKASLWYPGRCWMYVVTRADTKVAWLREDELTRPGDAYIQKP